MTDERDNEPVLVVTTPDNYLVQVGDPKYADKKELGKYAAKGYTIRTIKFHEYISENLTWIFDKPKTNFRKLK